MAKYQCNICKKNVSSVGVIRHSDERKLFVLCKGCSKKYEPINYDVEVQIVPVSPNTFSNILKFKKYFFPMHYKRKGGKYFAFYKTGKSGEIEYYAKVKSILKNIKEKDLPYEIDNLKNPKENSLFKVYLLEEIKKLDQPILKGKSGAIQNIRNTTLNKLKNSKSLKEL